MNELGTFDNSPLRYPGGKAKRATRLACLIDKSRKRYTEVFAGGLGMYFKCRRERIFTSYSINDIDSDLINFWTVLRDRPNQLIQQLWDCYRRHGAGDDDLFHQSKENLNSGNDIVRAVALYNVNRWTPKGDLQGGMLRTEKRRSGISPMILDRLPLFSELLSGVKITNLDYHDVEIPRNSFAFIDPPYDNIGTNFYQHKVDLDEFSDWAKSLNCSWLTTLNDSSFTNKLFSDFDRIAEPMIYPAVINPKFGSYRRREGTELVIMNYHRPTRDAFLRSFQWKLRKAQPSSKAC
jgi:site-specific DNA-adenine methylase